MVFIGIKDQLPQSCVSGIKEQKSPTAQEIVAHNNARDRLIVLALWRIGCPWP
jgi:hypothetical protein